MKSSDRYPKTGSPEFGNARWAEQFVEHGIIQSMATRVIRSGTAPTKKLFQEILLEDIEQAVNWSGMPPQHPKQALNRPIGFRA